MCPVFSPPLDTAAKTASCSQRDEDINAQRGMRGEGSVDGQKRDEVVTSR